MKFESVYLTNTGRVRKNNEDSLLVQEKILSENSMDLSVSELIDAEKAWFIVADGMGGIDAGEDASREVLTQLLQDFPGINDMDDFNKSLERAKERLDKFAAEKKIRLGTTLAGLFFSPGLNFAFNIGDCRVYKFSGGFLNRLTRDHSLLEEATRAGMDTTKVPHNIVTSAISGGESPNVRTFFKAVQPKPGEIFLVCSDGFWGPISEEEFEQAFQATSLLETANQLIPKALDKSRDNFTFIFVRVIS